MYLVCLLGELGCYSVRVLPIEFLLEVALLGVFGSERVLAKKTRPVWWWQILAVLLSRFRFSLHFSPLYYKSLPCDSY